MLRAPCSGRHALSPAASCCVALRHGASCVRRAVSCERRACVVRGSRCVALRHGALLRCCAAYVRSWELMGTCRNLWELIGTCGNLWELVGTYGNL